MKGQIEKQEHKKRARKKLDRKLTLGIIPDLDESNYDILDHSKPISSNFREKSCLVNTIKNNAAELAATIDRKIMHREQFKNLEKRNFYSQILSPQEENGALFGASVSNVRLKEEQ